jgi:hypothetical protein
MTKYYNPQRTRNVYDPASEKPFALSRCFASWNGRTQP